MAGQHPNDCTGQAIGGHVGFHVADHETLDRVVAEKRRVRDVR